MLLTRPSVLTAALMLACALALGQAVAAAPAPSWPQARSDVAADPSVRFGTLPNGMRYAVRRNATPTGQAALRLRFDAGSLMEADDEQGLAHFLEHMAFNGSRKVPEGEMVKILERHGLAFGADTNASTSWNETIYQLDLPTTSQETLETGLMLMRETAGELTLDPAAIDRERGVVLSEERARDTPGLRVFKTGLDFFLKGQLAPRRLPIGQVEVLRTAPAPAFRRFYHRYYRPERAVLVAVGDFDPDAMEARIKALFSDWKGVGDPGGEPQLGRPAKRGFETRLMVETGTSLTMQIEWLKPADRRPDSRARRAEKLMEILGFAVLNRRLERMARGASPPFIAAQASRSDVFHSADATVVTVAAQPDQWKTALTAAEQEQRRLIEHGVTAEELDREVREFRVALQAAVAGAATRRTPRLAAEIVQTLDEDEVYTSPQQDQQLFEEVIGQATPERVNAALRDAFSGEGPLLFMATPRPVEGGEAAVAAAFTASRAAPVAPPDASAAKTWPYADFGQPGKVAERRTLDDLQTTFVRFANGTRLTVKPTKFRDDQVLVRVRIGRGLLDLPKDRVTTAWASRGAFTEGGLKQLSAEEMERVLASNIYGADFSSAEDAYVLQGSTRPEDLALQLQVLTAFATDPGFRPEAFERMRGYMATLYGQMEATPSGVMGRELARLMHGGDMRFAFPEPQDVAASKPQDFEALFTPRLASGPVEVVIVGDVTVDRAIEVAAATLGALPPRGSPDGLNRQVGLPRATAQPVVLTHKGRADQAQAYAAWPTADFFADPQLARTLRLLAQVLELRLIEELREATGTTYSPQAGANASLTFPGYGYVSASVEVPPEKIDDFYRDLRKIAADLRTKEVTADELERARKPLVEGLLRSRQTNEYWLEQLSGAQEEPRRIDAIRGVLESLGKVDAKALKAAAERYLKDETLWRLQVVPEAAAKP